MCKSISDSKKAKIPKVPDDPKTPPAPPPPPPAASTLPMSPFLETKAKEFRDMFINNNAIYHLEGGQFAVSRAMRIACEVEINKITNNELKAALMDLCSHNASSDLSAALVYSGLRISKPYQDGITDPTHHDKNKLLGVLKSASIVNTTKQYKSATERAHQLMNATGVSPADKAIAVQMLDDTSANGDWAYDTINQWLAAPKIGPLTFTKVSLPRKFALYISATTMCAGVAGATARKLAKTPPLNPNPIPGFTPVSLSSPASKDSRSVSGNLVLKYPPAQLQSAMTAAAPVFTAGGFLVAGCLSGREWEKKDHPFPEHYILFFAMDGNHLLYWDPDVSSSNITELGTRLGYALGIATYDTTDPSLPTLSSGFDFADLFNIDGGGNHRLHTTRHRYQIAVLSKP